MALTSEFLGKSPNDIIIEKVWTTVDPKIKEAPCSCGGTLRFGVHSVSSNMNGQRVELKSVQAYRCDCEGCTVTLIPEKVGKEVKWLIDDAKGVKTVKHRIEGILRNY